MIYEVGFMIYELNNKNRTSYFVHRTSPVRGITLIELLIALTIFLTIGAVGGPAMGNYLVRSYQSNTDSVFVNALQTAQMSAMSGKGNSKWGVRVETSRIIAFQGSTYAGRTPAFDQVYDIPASITVSGVGYTIPADIIFDRLTGVINQAGTISFGTNTGDHTDVSINAEGAIDVN